jgi:hypothetical protein
MVFCEGGRCRQGSGYGGEKVGMVANKLNAAKVTISIIDMSKARSKTHCRLASECNIEVEK